MVTHARPRPRLGPLSRAGPVGGPARTDAALVGALTALAFVLHASQIRQSLFGDEVLAFGEIAGHTFTGTVSTVGSGVESSPPLFFALAWFAAKLGDPTVWVRLPSILLGTATVPVIFLLGRETFGAAAGRLAAAIAALSPFAAYYAVEARPYATAEFCVAVSTLAVVRAVRTGRRRDWALYAIATAAAAYSHYTVIFVLAVQGAWSLWRCRARPRAAVLANAGAAALYLPWLPELHGSSLATYAFLEKLTPGNVIIDALRPVIGYPYASLRAIPTAVGLGAVGVCVVGGVLARTRRTRRTRRPAPSQLLIVALAVATPVGLLLYSLLATDLWGARNLIASAPAQSVVLAVLLLDVPRRLRAPAVLLTLAVLAIGTARALGPYARPAYRSAAAIIDRDTAPRDPVVLPNARFVLDGALAAHLRRPHRLVLSLPRAWPQRPRGSRAFVVYGSPPSLRALAARTALPRPTGWVLVGHRTWRNGLLDVTLLVYRAR